MTYGLYIPFHSKGFPIDEYNRLALDRVKPITAPSAYSAVKGILPQQIPLFMYSQSLLQQGGEKVNLTLNERDKVLPTVFFGRLLSFHFFALFILNSFYDQG